MVLQEITALSNEQSFTLYGVSWEEMEAIAPVMEEHGVRLTYLDGILDLMTPSPEHEDYKRTIGLLVETYLRFERIRFYDRGSPRLGSRESNSRGEPDESYNLETKKPVPDLAIEIVFTSGGIGKLAKYERWGVPEVWFWLDRQKQLLIYYLEADGYKQMTKSALLPNLNVDLLVRCIKIEDQYDAVIVFEQALQERL